MTSLLTSVRDYHLRIKIFVVTHQALEPRFLQYA